MNKASWVEVKECPRCRSTNIIRPPALPTGFNLCSKCKCVFRSERLGGER